MPGRLLRRPGVDRLSGRAAAGCRRPAGGVRSGGRRGVGRLGGGALRRDWGSSRRHAVVGARDVHRPVTLYHLDARRGRTAMDAAGVLPGFTGVAVHDGLAAYRRYQQATHALCNAHHLRELAGIAEITGQQWPTALADLLVEAHVAVDAAK